MTWKGWEDYCGTSPAVGVATKKRSKYGAEKITVNGRAFDSKREAARYRDLDLRMKAGDIRRLRCQPRYALCPLIIEHGDVRDLNSGANSPRRSPVAEYIADFEYEESDRGHGGIRWRLVIEDVKGAKTDVYKLKKRWFEAQYSVRIKET